MDGGVTSPEQCLKKHFHLIPGTNGKEMTDCATVSDPKEDEDWFPVANTKGTICNFDSCVKGKKLVFDAKMRYECVTIPETRYRFVTRRITKEVTCPACVPTCETTDVCRCYESEKWTTDHL